VEEKGKNCRKKKLEGKKDKRKEVGGRKEEL
jgi:hypothetical protein